MVLLQVETPSEAQLCDVTHTGIILLSVSFHIHLCPLGATSINFIGEV